ncbi:DUF3450 domain-containing protein [Veronia pacifica]|uniref:DUF3450 domain-containing protein n=1 Tax=Veronia pacifica TaxID=1080227 RepID=A0A1C3EE87_9GAMM|nr:DUF3450 domain-containing protein [Veronia pacifica]ODA31545.1 hypothetical protein A8L45_16745 [Veronia pacifica]
MKIIVTSLIGLFFSVFSIAGTLERASEIEGQTLQSSAQVQQRIDRRAENILKMKSEIEQLDRETENLTIYQSHLVKLIENQEHEKAELRNKISELADTRMGIVPLMYRMIDSLEPWVAQDIPIKKQQRLTRVAQLRSLMTRADVSVSEKFRRVLEAYRIEMEYGQKLGIFKGQIAQQGLVRDVDMLHFGRVSLVARSPDKKSYWLYSRKLGEWELSSGKVKPEIDDAFALAEQSGAPRLINLPLSVGRLPKDGGVE